MKRKFEPFDADVINAEFAALPGSDRYRLMISMKRYQDEPDGNYRPARVDSYGDGLLRIRHESGDYQGRALFSRVRSMAGRRDVPQRLVLLVVYKKESDSVPRHILQRARDRKTHWEEANGRELH